ncbi:hypothetical protein F4802DRAFT_325060 [Xylaria palmicola]|nr:hypothetical protein F4802DRAFT_325060 [Xylaria palmicola]
MTIMKDNSRLPSQRRDAPKKRVCDLDDPDLISKFSSQPANAGDLIVSHFRALPAVSSGRDAFSHDMSQYGHVLAESRDRLAMRVQLTGPDALFEVQQAWVSKYLAPYTRCTLAFGMPELDRAGNILFWILLKREPTEDIDSKTEHFAGMTVKDHTNPRRCRSASLPLTSSLPE